MPGTPPASASGHDAAQRRRDAGIHDVAALLEHERPHRRERTADATTAREDSTSGLMSGCSAITCDDASAEAASLRRERRYCRERIPCRRRRSRSIVFNVCQTWSSSTTIAPRPTGN
jgi:hypothetical protein